MSFMFKSKAGFLILIVLFILTLTGCKDESATKDTKDQVEIQKKELSKLSVRLAWIPGATFIGDYVAHERGYWKDEGLEVKLNPGGFEFDAIKLVASGADDFGIASGPQILYARAHGAPVIAIGAVIPRSPIGWVAKKNSGIKTPKDFLGKKIGAQFGTHTEITFEALCAKMGIDIKSVNRIPVKFDPRLFIAGEIDVLPVYLVDQPIDLRINGLELNIIDPGDFGVSLAFGNLYFTTEERLKDNPESIRAFLAGSAKGWKWAYENRTAAIEILSKYVQGSDKGTLLGKLNATFDFIHKDQKQYLGVFRMKSEDWTKTKAILSEFGDLDEKIDLEKCYTNDFIPN